MKFLNNSFRLGKQPNGNQNIITIIGAINEKSKTAAINNKAL